MALEPSRCLALTAWSFETIASTHKDGVEATTGIGSQVKHGRPHAVSGNVPRKDADWLEPVTIDNDANVSYISSYTYSVL